MKDLVLRIYDWMGAHRGWCVASLAVVTLLMVLSVTRLSYKEDIRDFLPLDEAERAALNDYDRQAQTSLIVAIVEHRDSTVDDPDLLVEGVETFLDAIRDVKDLTVQTDFSQMEEQQEEVYRQLPYLLEPADYRRMDSLLQQPDFIPLIPRYPSIISIHCGENIATSISLSVVIFEPFSNSLSFSELSSFVG